MSGKVLDFYSTSFGDIYILEFDETNFVISGNTMLTYEDKIFEIKSFSLGPNNYYNRSGDLVSTKARSLILSEVNSLQVEIPVGTVLNVISKLQNLPKKQ